MCVAFFPSIAYAQAELVQAIIDSYLIEWAKMVRAERFSAKSILEVLDESGFIKHLYLR